MDKAMSESLEPRIKAIELKIQFLESWKNSPYIQITIPLIISLFLATSWVNIALAQMDKRMDRIEARMDKFETRMDKLEDKMDKVLAEISELKKKA